MRAVAGRRQPGGSRASSALALAKWANAFLMHTARSSDFDAPTLPCTGHAQQVEAAQDDQEVQDNKVDEAMGGGNPFLHELLAGKSRIPHPYSRPPADRSMHLILTPLPVPLCEAKASPQNLADMRTLFVVLKAAEALPLLVLPLNETHPPLPPFPLRLPSQSRHGGWRLRHHLDLPPRHRQGPSTSLPALQRPGGRDSLHGPAGRDRLSLSWATQSPGRVWGNICHLLCRVRARDPVLP